MANEDWKVKKSAQQNDIRSEKRAGSALNSGCREMPKK
jgi:hypothetical protein